MIATTGTNMTDNDRRKTADKTEQQHALEINFRKFEL